MRKVAVQQLGYVLLALAFVVGLHQYVVWGYFFEMADLHHETFIIALTFAGFCVLVLASNIWRRKR